MKGTFGAVVLLLASACLAGCSTLRGAPKAPFDLDKVERSELFANPEGQLNTLARATTIDDRNNAMMRVLALIDIRYAHFRHNLAANKRHSSAITSGLLLAADVAAGLTTSVGVKDNYLAFSALLTGGELIYDKNYLYEQTIAALVTKMDATRSSKLLEIRNAMAQQTIDQYPGQVAVNDLLQYYHAGTLLGAITAIQVEAGAKAHENAELLRELVDASMETIERSRDETVRLDQLIDGLDEAQSRNLQSYLVGKGLTVESADKDELRAALKRLRSHSYRDDFDALVKSLGSIGLVVPATAKKE